MRRLQQIMTGESIFAGLLQRRQHQLALEARIRGALPPSLATCIAVADNRTPELALAATSGAAAALLRQRAPDLLRILVADGWEFTGIRVRVQARPGTRPPTKSPKKQLDAPAAALLMATAQTLGDSPLAAALTRLARSARGAASQHHEHPPQREKDEHDEQ
jgi:hypothetical protein